MKKVLMFAMFAILLAGFALAVGNNSGSLSNSDDDEDDNNSLISANNNSDDDEGVCEGLTQAGCEANSLCEYDSEDTECELIDDEDENETEIEDEEECEAWECTKWSACVDGISKRTCTKTIFNCTEDNEKPKITRNCNEKERIRVRGKLTECPSDCVCTGSTLKCTFENGTRVMTVYAGKSGNVIVQIQNINMSTNVTLYKNEEGKVYGVFRNNETKEIKMPDEIREKLQNRTKTRLYNESINLTEEGYYEMDMNKRARLFWIVPVREHMEAQVNAETGETIEIRNPWWGFLAKDTREDSED